MTHRSPPSTSTGLCGVQPNLADLSSAPETSLCPCDRLAGLIAGLLTAQKLLNEAAETAADLELQLSPLNAALVLQRSILELGMPQVHLVANTPAVFFKLAGGGPPYKRCLGVIAG